MTEFGSWADYESRRNMGRRLIIYGSGKAGSHFVNHNKLSPFCFCDERARDVRELVSEDLHIYPVYMPDEITNYAGSGPLDVIVALTKTDHILSFLNCAIKMFPEDSAFYIYHCFDFTEKKIKPYFKDVLINGEYVLNGKANVWDFNIVRIMDNFEKIHDYNVKEHLSMLKSCYKNPDIVTVEYLRKQMSALRETFSRGCFMTVNENRINHPVREKAVRVYLFGNCQLQAYASSYENGFENYLYQELNRYGSYDIYNYGSRVTQSAFDLYRQLLAAQPEKDSIVLFNCCYDMEELQYWVLSRQYCEIRKCRFIGFPFADIYHREVFSDYEKYLLMKKHPGDTAETVKKLRQIRIKQREVFLSAVSGYHIQDFYYFSRRFLRSGKALFVDGRHLGDWGNEALALDAADMILRRCAPAVNPETVRQDECRKFVVSMTAIVPDFEAKLDHLTKKIERGGWQARS